MNDYVQCDDIHIAILLGGCEILLIDQFTRHIIYKVGMEG